MKQHCPRCGAPHDPVASKLDDRTTYACGSYIPPDDPTDSAVAVSPDCALALRDQALNALQQLYHESAFVTPTPQPLAHARTEARRILEAADWPLH